MKNMQNIIFPRLAANEIVEIKGVRYKASFWSDRTYEFETVDDKPAPHHGAIRTEQYVSDKIKEGIIKRF